MGVSQVWLEMSGGAEIKMSCAEAGKGFMSTRVSLGL